MAFSYKKWSDSPETPGNTNREEREKAIMGSGDTVYSAITAFRIYCSLFDTADGVFLKENAY
jgi:hypothetical protein